MRWWPQRTCPPSSVHLAVLSSGAQHATIPGIIWHHFQGQCSVSHTFYDETVNTNAYVATVSFSPPKLQQVFSSSESSPQPEKISLEDLTGGLSGTQCCSLLLVDFCLVFSPYCLKHNQIECGHVFLKPMFAVYVTHTTDFELQQSGRVIAVEEEVLGHKLWSKGNF